MHGRSLFKVQAHSTTQAIRENSGQPAQKVAHKILYAILMLHIHHLSTETQQLYNPKQSNTLTLSRLQQEVKRKTIL